MTLLCLQEDLPLFEHVEAVSTEVNRVGGLALWMTSSNSMLIA